MPATHPTQVSRTSISEGVDVGCSEALLGSCTLSGSLSVARGHRKAGSSGWWGTCRAVAVQSSRPLRPQPLPPVVSRDPTGTSHWPSTELHSPSVLLTRITSRPLLLSPRWPLPDLRFVWLRPLSPRHRVLGAPSRHKPEHLCTPSRRLHGLAHGSPLCLRPRRHSQPVACSPPWPARAPQVLPLGPSRRTADGS